MKTTDTDALQQELMGASDLGHFLSERQESFSHESAQDILNRLIAARSISKAALARQAGMSEIYLHQILAGRRNPSRNRLICICFGLNASLEETQELLKRCGQAQLYVKNRRDAIIIYGLHHGANLNEINDKLFSEDEDTLF